MNEGMLYKDLAVDAVKDVDTVKGIVTGYFSVFGNKDADGDIVMPGAFKKSLKENGPSSERPRILHLYQHDPYKPLAKPAVLKEDKRGLYFESQISLTQLGKDVIQLYQDKVLSEHSIGYQVVKREVDEKQEETKLLELKLWEGSTVSWGANMEALTESVKSTEEKVNMIDFLVKKMDAIESALHGSYTDETARQLEISLKQIQTLIISLARKEEPVSSTPIIDKPIELSAEWILSRLII